MAGSDDDATDDLADRFAVLRQAKLIYSAQLAEAFHSPAYPWSTKKATRWLQKSGIGFQLSKRGPWVTTSTEIAKHYPQLWQLVLEREIDQL